MSFRAKLENIWYHYKSHILVSVFLICVLIVALQSCVTKSEYDIQVYYVAGSSSLYQEQLDWIQASVATCCGDVNGDGAVNVAVTGLRVGTFSDPAMRAQYMNAVQAGEVMLLFGDSGGIDYLVTNNYLQPLTDFTDKATKNGYAWSVSDSGFSTRVPGYEMFSDVELFVGLRVFDNTWSAATESCKENYQVARAALQGMVSALPEYDLRVCYLTAESTADANKIRWIETALAPLSRDVNGDGKVSVKVTALNLANGPTLEKYLASLSGDARLFFTDEAALKILQEKELLASLSSLGENLALDGYAKELTGTPFAASFAGYETFGEKKLFLALYKELNEDSLPDAAALSREVASGILTLGLPSEE